MYGKGLNGIETIKKIFGKSSRDIKWKDFSKYCVSDFLKMDTHGLSWSSSSVHYLLLRQMKNNDPNGLWFMEGDESFQFVVDEDCLITGLKGHYDGDINISDDDSLIKAYFSKMDVSKPKWRSIKQEELNDAFSNCTKNQDKVKLDVAYFIKCVVLGNWTEKLIDMDTLPLVTDVNAFNVHP